MPVHRFDFRRLKRQASFEPVLARYGLADGNARPQRHILCPFHRESEPSCHLNDDRKTFHCFGCGTRGSILDFVAKLEKCGIAEAAAIVASCCGIADDDVEAVVRDNTDDRSLGQERREVHATEPGLTARNAPLKFALALDPSHPYLPARGLNRDEVERFGIGYCDHGLMRGRIAIPIHNEEGELVAYAGRWAARDVPAGRPRYLLPPKFHKQRVLYNLHRVKGQEHLVVVESYWSVFRLSAFDIQAVALMGRDLSEAHVDLLRRARVQRLSLMLDSDAPGRSAVARMLPVLGRHFFVRDLELPAGTKPHSATELAIKGLLGLI